MWFLVLIRLMSIKWGLIITAFIPTNGVLFALIRRVVSGWEKLFRQSVFRLDRIMTLRRLRPKVTRLLNRTLTVRVSTERLLPSPTLGVFATQM